MQSEVVEILQAAKKRLEAWNSSLNDGSLGKSKNNDVIERIKAILPEKGFDFDTKRIKSDLVYPKRG